MDRFVRNLLGGLAVLCWAGASPARAEWLRAQSPHFTVYSEGNEKTLRGRVERLEDFDRLLRQLTGTTAPPSPTKLTLYFVRGSGQLRSVFDVGSDVAGFYAATPDGIVAVVDHGSREDYVTHEEVLHHEYAHHFMLQYFPSAYPLWYVEGFAEYVSTARLGEGSIEVGRFNEIRASWLADPSGWLPLERILFSDPTKMAGDEVDKFYAQSWLLVHYLLRDPERRRKLSQNLSAVGRGDEPRLAFSKAFAGTNVSSLQRALISYGSTSMTFSRVPRISASQAAPVSVVSLGGPGELVVAQASVVLTRTKDADRLLRQVRATAKGRQDALARRVLARAEALYGDGNAADRLLDPLMAAAPADAELLYLKGMRHLVAGRRDATNRASHFQKAQGWFVRAHRVDGNHFSALYRYAESLSLEPKFLTENTTNVLLLAHKLAPQVQEITLSTANVLLRHEDYSRAETLLAPLASDPHGKALAKAARFLLAKARAKDKSGLPDPFVIPEEAG